VLHFFVTKKSRATFVAAIFTFALSALTFSVVADDAAVGPQAPLPVNKETLLREGMAVDFKVEPLKPERTGGKVMEGDFATISFRITGAEDNEPLQGVYPGVWIDLVQTAEGEKKGVSLDCKNRVATYLQGLVGMRPMIDLNSYFVMVLNQDPSISVIDPVVGITGITSLYTSIPLERPGADWAKTTDEKWLYVSMPRSGKLAVVNLDTFKVEKNLPAGEMPMRVAIQPDEKYLWVGNDVQGGTKSGVTVIDVESGEIAASILTGAGHHEISFSADSRRAFVTNRESGAVTVIDTGKLEIIKEVDSGSLPISVAYSALSDAAYAADGASGIITVIDPETGQSFAQIETAPGLGPMRFSNDGRWGFVVNPEEDLVYIIDASVNKLAHTVKIENRPFQIALTDTFAYIRSLDSERIAMINLQELNRGGDVIVNNFAAGVYPPSQVNDIRIADAMVPAAQDAAVLIASPADATVYYYMEGMNAPMGAFRNYGHKPRAVQIANRALKELEPGLYSTTVKIPMAGTFEVVEFLNERERLVAGDEMTLRFRLYKPGSGKTFVDAGGVTVKFFRAPRYDLTELVASHVGEGIYEATLPFRDAGSYYIYVAAPELQADYQDLNYKTVLVGKARTSQNIPATGQ